MVRGLLGIEGLKAGVVSGLDMTLEAAVTKLMFLFGQEYSGATLKAAMQSSLRGELSSF